MEWIKKRLNIYHRIETIASFKISDTILRSVKDSPKCIAEPDPIGRTSLL